MYYYVTTPTLFKLLRQTSSQWSSEENDTWIGEMAKTKELDKA